MSGDALAQGLGGGPDPSAERGTTPVSAVAPGERYDRMTGLAELFDRTGNELRERSRLGADILSDDDVIASAPLSPRTWEAAESEIHRATTGKAGLLPGATELDADALVVRATVLTYRWIDELAATATRTLGSIAGRAIGYLAPEVELGGAVVAAGLIETDADDREGVAGYLGELARSHPDLMDHISTAGGLLEGLQLRTLLTPGLGLLLDEADGGSRGDAGAGAGLAGAGLRAAGVPPFEVDPVGAVRDVAGELVDPATGGTAAADPDRAPAAPALDADAPDGLEELMTTLAGTSAEVEVHRTAPGRFVVYLPGRDGLVTAGDATDAGTGERLRLVGGDHASYADRAARVLDAAVAAAGTGPDDPPATVMAVGGGRGGVVAAELATRRDHPSYEVDVAVTVASPSSQVPRVPAEVRVLSLEDSADPVALLGSLITAGDEHRTSVVFDAGDLVGPPAWVAGGRAADAADHEGLRAELALLRERGYLR